MTLPPTYTLAEVAQTLGVTTRFLRPFIKANHVEHLRVGNGDNARIRFTEEQATALQAMFTQAPVVESITTGRGRRAS